MPLLFIDCETRSELNITDVGAYKYLGHHSTELLMVAYAYGDEPVKLWECHKGPMPEDLRRGLEDPLQTIVAWNCQFERLACYHLLKIFVPVERFEDPMIRSRYMSMPGKLEKVGKILDIQSKKLTEFFIKDESLVELFSLPLEVGGKLTLFGIEPTTYRDWDTHQKEWAKFCEYCMIDVEAMREIFKRESKFPLPDFEYEMFALNEEINDRGIYTDSMLMQGATSIVEKEFEALRKEFTEVSGIKNPRSNQSVLKYMRLHGYTFQSLNKQYVNRALKGECTLDEAGRRILELRLQLGKSSVSKLEALRDAVEPDDRVRGLFNFFGAPRTGRWSSGIVQVQNLVKPTKAVEKKFDLAMSLLKAGDYEKIKKEFDNPIDVACAAIRPIFRAPKDKKLVIADLAAIESRGAGWVANCETLNALFREHEIDCTDPREDHLCCKGKDPYLSFAVLMDGNRTYEELYKLYKAGDKTTRTLAKPPTLGCGYGLGAGEITQDEEGNIVKTGLLGYAGAMGIDLPVDYAIKAVTVFRNAYVEITQFWWRLHEAFVEVTENGGSIELGPLTIEKKGRVVAIWLPSGRALHYINPQVAWVDAVSQRTGRKYKRAEITIEGQDQKTHQWTRIPTRGAKLFENVVQAICRDILACGMVEAKKSGFDIVLTCHDEIMAEVPKESSLSEYELVAAMTKPLAWCPGFLTGAEGYTTDFYKKE